MAVCIVCGTDYSANGEMLDIDGTRYQVCGDCARRAKTNPAQFEADLRRLEQTNPA